MIGTEVEGFSESEIAEQLDSNGAGMGDYTVEISVNAKVTHVRFPGNQQTDGGENVSYTVNSSFSITRLHLTSKLKII